MTENETLQVLKTHNDKCSGCDKLCDDLCKPAIEIALKAIEEIQQYRAIGTVEEIKEILQIISDGQDDVDESGISTGLLHTLLEYAEYKKIGTVEECREARERQAAKKPIISHIGQVNDRGKAHCPNCRQEIHGIGRIRHCFYCGQAIDWSE